MKKVQCCFNSVFLILGVEFKTTFSQELVRYQQFSLFLFFQAVFRSNLGVGNNDTSYVSIYRHHQKFCADVVVKSRVDSVFARYQYRKYWYRLTPLHTPLKPLTIKRQLENNKKQRQ
eukprot:TRINITY_DN425_c3_g1_i2.p1 TRINITY_DN425_c3_g1~~TRINITY_DN425_c3_g1_i2.p1  ORF type:complete len:117 (-),score=1.14 TRINITY_DN425_c3_g1_i2:14-364(-)